MTSNPLDDLRQINRQQRAEQEVAVMPHLREDGSTVLSEDVGTDGREDAGTSVREAGSKPVRKDERQAGRAAMRKDSRKEGQPQGGKDGEMPSSSSKSQGLDPDLRTQVRDTVSEKRIYQGGVKATLDLAPDLSTRFKRYSIDHHNVTLRQLMTELLNAYLSGEGY